MEGKGIGTVRDGISYTSKDRDIYSIRSAPKPPAEWTSINSRFGEADKENIEDAVMARLTRSRFGKGLKAFLKYTCLALFTPFYFLFYCIPKLIWDNALNPIIKLIIRLLNPPVQAVIRFVKRTSDRIIQFMARRKAQLLRLCNAFVAAVKGMLLRIFLPIRRGVTAALKKVQSLIVKAFKVLLRPVFAIIHWVKMRIFQPTQTIFKRAGQKVGSAIQKVNNTGGKAVNVASHKLEVMTSSAYDAALRGGLAVNRLLQYVLAGVIVFPRYVAQVAKEVSVELQQWFSFR